VNSGQTADRVYEALKQRVCNRGFRPGARLDPAHLSSELVSSVTPVRDALNRLTGERLVETRASDGFHLPQIDAPMLQDLYDWSIETLALAMRRWPERIEVREHPPGASSAARARALFGEIGRLSANAEHGAAIASVSDRLNAARICEPLVFDDCPDELARIATALAADRRSELRTALATYHRRRRRIAADIVRALYRAPTNGA
jgi:DNA-binding GntR family transcriptional regulator